MTTKIPILTNCNIGENEQDNVLIMDLAKYLQKNPNLSFPHRHNFYHFVLFQEGQGSFTIDFTNFTISPYRLYFMTPGQVHTWEFETVPQGYLVNFSADFFQSFLLRPDYLNRFSFLSGIAEDSALTIPEHTQQDVIYLLEKAKDAYEKGKVNPDKKNQDLISTILLHLMFSLEELGMARKQSAGVSPTHHLLIQNFRKLVENHFMNEKFPKFYAEKLNVSPNHLNSVCQNLMGVPAGEVIRQRIVLEAKRMLINPHITISALAYELDFNDNSYFTKFFKKATQMTPEEFRKKHQLYGITKE